MSIDLPEKLFVPAINTAATPEAVKATSPEGLSVPIAFTKLEYLQFFAKETGLDKHEPSVGHIEIATGEFLNQLAEEGEPELVVDALQKGETKLSYDKSGTVSQQIPEENAAYEVNEPTVPLEDEHIERLKKVATSLPHVLNVWLLEMTIRDKDDEDKIPVPRPLLVVEQDIEQDHEEYQDTWMELGDQWCEHLPRGTAVDMLPHHAGPVTDYLKDEVKVYSRA
ncbi:MAG: hypothetical protein L3J82_02785 [Planctomycetes bacterium]|nr:hypothetical protein [Planctomycetota bacterium]